jgi:hypothetical protein
MTRAILLVIMLLVASPVGLALDPIVSKATAAELVRDALASLGEGHEASKIPVLPWDYYWAPDFITLQAEILVPSTGTVAMQYFAVNPWTGDVWEPFGCTRITSPTIKRKQDEIWKSSKLPDEARHVLEARVPACTPPNAKRSPEQR